MAVWLSTATYSPTRWLYIIDLYLYIVMLYLHLWAIYSHSSQLKCRNVIIDLIRTSGKLYTAWPWVKKSSALGDEAPPWSDASPLDTCGASSPTPPFKVCAPVLVTCDSVPVNSCSFRTQTLEDMNTYFLKISCVFGNSELERVSIKKGSILNYNELVF